MKNILKSIDFLCRQITRFEDTILIENLFVALRHLSCLLDNVAIPQQSIVRLIIAKAIVILRFCMEDMENLFLEDIFNIFNITLYLDEFPKVMGNAPKNLKNLLLTYLYYESQDSEEVKKKLMTLAEDMKDLSWINKKLLRKLRLYKSTQKHRANNHFLSQLLHNFCELFDLVGPPPDTEISLVQKGLSFCEEAIFGDNLEKDKSIFKQLTSDDDFKFVEGEGKYYRKRNCVFKEITSGRVFPTDCNKVTSTPNSGGVPMKENFIANNFSYRSSTPLSYKKARLNEKESLSPAAVSLAKFTLNDYTALSLHFNQRSRRHWTSEEIKLLLEGIKANGVGKWSSILSFITLAKPEFNRTSTDLKDKWRNLLNKKDPAALKVMNSTDFSAQLGRNQRKSETSKLLERLDTIKRKAGEALMSD